MADFLVVVMVSIPTKRAEHLIFYLRLNNRKLASKRLTRMRRLNLMAHTCEPLEHIRTLYKIIDWMGRARGLFHLELLSLYFSHQSQP